MSGSFHRLGRLWMLSKQGSIGRGKLTKVSVKSTTAFHKCEFNSQIRSLSSETSQRKESTAIESEDRIQFFIRPEVQTLLVELTGRDYNRIFRKRRLEQKIRQPKYSFMTEAQLQEVKRETEKNADKLLQMPPVLRPRKPIDHVLSFDPMLQGIESSTIIFTDISPNIVDKDRVIVARDPDGTLRQASWDEREKMNKIYFPEPGREFITPKLFTDQEVLQNVLNRASEEDNSYEFVLDRACLQFEPDDPLFINAAEMTYETIDRRGHYEFLKSTRHYGPMVFYLVRMRKFDGLLVHSVKQKRVSTDAINLVKLFHILFPESKSKSTSQDDNHIAVLQKYIQLDSTKRGELELVLNVYLEEEARKQELEEGLKRQHGIQQ